MEIFDHWWEYFLVLSWSFSPPKFKKIGGELPPSLNHFKDQYTKEIENLSKDEKSFTNFMQQLNHLEDFENKTRNTIEDKAHLMVSQSGVAATLLVAAISLFTFKSNNWSNIQSIWIYSFLTIITLNLVAAALLARNVIVLEYRYPKQVISELTKEYLFIDSLIEQIFIIKHSSYYNNIKASFLRFAHWYFKATFICILVLVLTLPFLYFFQPIEKSNELDSHKINIENSINQFPIETILNEAKKESLDIKNQDIDSILINQQK